MDLTELEELDLGPLPEPADRERVRQAVGKLKTARRTQLQFYEYLDDLLDRIHSVPDGWRRFPKPGEPWCYAFALGLLDDDRALQLLLQIHDIGGGTGKCNIEELGRALDKHVHRVGFSLIYRLWPNKRTVSKNTEIIVLNNLTYDVRCSEVFELLDATNKLLSDKRRARGNRIELMQLRRHLRYSLESLYQYDVFVCHATKDKQRFVDQFVEALREQGYSCWYDADELLVGDDIAKKIRAGLEDSLFVAVVVSHASQDSIWVRREVADAFNKVASERRECFLPIVLDEDVQIPFELSPARCLHPLRDGFERTFEELIEKISRYAPR